MRIKQRVELFNRAFPMAWCQLTPPRDPTLSWELSERVGALVKASINAGIDNAQAIADAVVAKLKK
jgi:hypothetical protein